jgi:uncharacterized membrane protein
MHSLLEGTMPMFSFGPALSLRGRQSRGLRGFAGKPFHPPLTDLPIVAYLFAAVFDVLSLALYSGHPEVGLELYRAASWVLLGGAAVSLLTAFTGFLDWLATPTGTQVRRTANAHAVTMLTVTVLVLVDLILRLTAYLDEAYAEPPLVVLSVLAALLTLTGAAIGGSLVYDYAVAVEKAGDSAPSQPGESATSTSDERAAGST